MMIFHCWRCDRGLNIDRAPEREDVVVICHRCKAKNVVRAGLRPAPVMEAPPRLSAIRTAPRA